MVPAFELGSISAPVDLLAVPVFAGRRLGPGGPAVDAALDGTLAE